MRSRRAFDEKFKRPVKESVLSGSISQTALSRKYSISTLYCFLLILDALLN